MPITTCMDCGKLYEVRSEEEASAPYRRYCPDC